MVVLEACSKVGKTTQMQLDSLRRQLAIGTDPAYDYTKEIAAKAAAKKESMMKKMSKNDAEAKLRDAIGSLSQIDPNAEDGREDERPVELQGMGSNSDKARARREQAMNKPTWAFANQNWNQIKEHYDAIVDKPVESELLVKEDLTQPKVLISSFGYRPPHVGLKTKELNQQIRALETEGKVAEARDLLKHSVSLDHLGEAPKRVGARMSVYKFDHSRGHKKPDELCNIVFNVNSFDNGLENCDKLNGFYTQYPAVNFDHSLGHVPLNKSLSSFFLPGKYKPKYNSVRRRDDMAGVGWDRGNVGKPFRKNEVQVFVPDRSLARLCPFVEPRILSPDLTKSLPRPSPASRIVSDTSMKPECEDLVLQKRMTFDVGEAEKYTLSRLIVPNFKTYRSRSLGMLGSRAYADDKALQQARNADVVTSVETLPVEALDSSLTHPRLLIPAFDAYLTREVSPSPREQDKPKRKVDQLQDVMTFVRSPRRGGSYTNAGDLSPLARSVGNMRKTRLHVDLSED